MYVYVCIVYVYMYLFIYLFVELGQNDGYMDEYTNIPFHLFRKYC